MRKNTEKMTITFENAPLVRSLAGAFAVVQNQSMSGVIERTVLDALLPRNKIMRDIAEKHLFGANGNVGNALLALFDANIAGDDSGEADHSNLLPLVQFACGQVDFYDLSIVVDSKMLQFSAAQLHLLLGYLRQQGENADDMVHPASYYAYEFQMGTTFLQEMKERSSSFKTQDIYRLIIRNWSDIANYSVTYSLLYSLVQMNEGWSAEAQDKLQLLQIMKDISAKW